MKKKLNVALSALLILSAALSSVSSASQNAAQTAASGTPIIWKDPGEVSQLDFVGGAGGRDKAPKPPFAFVEENLSGSNPKVRVTDADGVRWSVKFGSEVKSEVFATRMLWAVGYFVEPAYFVPSGKIEDLGELKRAKSVIQPDGSFVNARFERQREKGVKNLEEEQSWSWVQNPFLNSRELNGLKVMMMLVSNWDNKDVRDVKRGSNTAIFVYPESESRYLVSDWGGSMGKWGGFVSREKWDCKGYAEQTPSFVKGIRGDYFVWGYSGQHTKDFNGDIRIADVRWLMQYLGGITDDQIRSGLQASGATPDEIDCFARAVRDRINQIRSCIE